MKRAAAQVCPAALFPAAVALSLLTLAALSASAWALPAQERVIRSRSSGDVIFIRNSGGPQPRAASASTPSSPESTADLFMQSFGRHFGGAGSYQQLKSAHAKNDAQGLVHVRYRQLFGGVPVYGAQVIVHLRADGGVSSAGGRAASKLTVNTKPRIAPKKALRLARLAWRKEFGANDSQLRAVRLYVLSRRLIDHRLSPRDYLVWRVQLVNRRSPRNIFYFVDAKRARIVMTLSGAQSDLSRRVWDCGTDNGADCYLNEEHSVYGQPVMLGRSESQPARPLHPVIDDDLGVNQTNRIYDMLGYVYNYYAEKYGQNGANASGGIGCSSDDDYCQTFPASATSAVTYLNYYSGNFLSCPNAAFDGQGAIWFCIETVATDILAHEYTHAMDYYLVDENGSPAGLIYHGESGALNEAYSDIFGSAVENYAENGAGDWTMGEDSMLGVIRDMSNPTAMRTSLGYMPDRFSSGNVYCGVNDNSGVHHNSSIPAYAAYLMAEGGQFNGCSISPVGREIEEAVLYYALRDYLVPSSDFEYAFNALITACEEHYGQGSTACKQITKALMAVEMNQPGRCSGQPAEPPDCNAIDNPDNGPNPDVRAPLIEILAPLKGDKVKAKKKIAFMDDELTAPQCSLDKLRWISCQSGATKVKQLPGWKAVTGGFTLYVRDTDDSGNTGLTFEAGIKKKKKK